MSLAVGDSGVVERQLGDGCEEDEKRAYSFNYYKKKLDTLSKAELAEEIKLYNRRNRGTSSKKLGASSMMLCQ